MTGTSKSESIRTLYSENMQLVRANLDARYKVLTNFLIATGGIFILLRWMQEIESLQNLTFLPMAIAGVYSIISGVMDLINGRLLNDGWEVGERLEKRLDTEGGFFTQSNQTYDKTISFNKLFSWLYFGLGFVLLIISIFFALAYFFSD